MFADVVFGEVDVLDAVGLAKRNREMLNTNRMIEQLVKGSILNLLLIFHLDLQYLAFVHVCIPNHILAQVDRGDRIVHF